MTLHARGLWEWPSRPRFRFITARPVVIPAKAGIQILNAAASGGNQFGERGFAPARRGTFPVRTRKVPKETRPGDSVPARWGGLCPRQTARLGGIHGIFKSASSAPEYRYRWGSFRSSQPVRPLSAAVSSVPHPAIRAAVSCQRWTSAVHRGTRCTWAAYSR